MDIWRRRRRRRVKGSKKKIEYSNEPSKPLMVTNGIYNSDGRFKWFSPNFWLVWAMSKWFGFFFSLQLNSNMNNKNCVVDITIKWIFEFRFLHIYFSHLTIHSDVYILLFCNKCHIFFHFFRAPPSSTPFPSVPSYHPSSLDGRVFYNKFALIFCMFELIKIRKRLVQTRTQCMPLCTK